MNKDVIVATIADTHSGGSTALFPPDIRYFKHGAYTPFSVQKDIFTHWMECAKGLKIARKGKKLVVVFVGDAVDGNHHGTPQFVTMLPNEQIAIHVELMKAFLTEAGFKYGVDELYYMTGTETHVDDNEDEIGRRLQAIPNGNIHTFDELKLEVNGRWLWFTHHGPATGRGVNQGNALRNWLRDLFEECKQENLTPPDFVITGHVHKPYYSVHVGRLNGQYHSIHGMITPSWQSKTRYAYKVAALQKNKIGMQWFGVTKEGGIVPPTEMLMR